MNNRQTLDPKAIEQMIIAMLPPLDRTMVDSPAMASMVDALKKNFIATYEKYPGLDIEDIKRSLDALMTDWKPYYTDWRLCFDYVVQLADQWPLETLEQLPASFVVDTVKFFKKTYKVRKAPKTRLIDATRHHLEYAAEQVKRAYFEQREAADARQGELIAIWEASKDEEKKTDSPPPIEAIKQSLNGYSLMRSGREVAMLTRTDFRLDATTQLMLRADGLAGVIINKDASGKDFTVVIEKYKELINGVRPTANILLDMLILNLTQNGHKDGAVRIPVDEYMKIRGLKDRKAAIEQVREDMRALDRITMTFYIPKRPKRDKRNPDELNAIEKKAGGYADIKISGGGSGVVKGDIFYFFGHLFLQLLQGYPVMPVPDSLFRVNPKTYPYTYHLGRKILEHKSMNYGKPNADYIGVRTLLACCPGMPKYEDVAAKGRQISQLIIDPFERNMDAIEFCTWNYCGKNGTPVDIEDYQDFEDANVHIHWKEYPDRIMKNTPKKKLPKKRTTSEQREPGTTGTVSEQ